MNWRLLFAVILLIAISGCSVFQSRADKDRVTLDQDVVERDLSQAYE
jgi:hypothetical protein